jgi:hypothetical protein
LCVREEKRTASEERKAQSLALARAKEEDIAVFTL